MTNTTPSWIASINDATIKADMITASAAGSVSESAMAKLFVDLGAELSANKSTLSASQLADLKLISADLAQGESVSAYIAYVTDALINGNRANASWTGGAASSISLGNLAAGATATQITELADKWFLGSDLPSSSVSMSGTSSFSIHYSAVSSPLFAASGPSMSDINQGYLGDCYLLSALAEVAKQNPSIIKSMITSNGNNSYGVRFFVNGVAEYVTVNNSLADGGDEFNSAPNIWASLVEKAYAQLQAGGVVTGNSAVNHGNSYSTIGNGGSPEYTLLEITGASAVTDFNANGANWYSITFNSGMAQTGYSPGLSTESVLATLLADLAKGYDLVLSSSTNATDAAGKTTLVANHCLSIYGYDSATGEFEVRNPWGSASGQTWDTSFEVSLATLLADGDSITVDNVTLSSANSGASSGAVSAPLLANQTANQVMVAGHKLSFALSAATFSDPQGLALSYSAKQASGAALPSWLSFNAATETFSGTAPVNAAPLAITVTATDSAGLSASESFTLGLATAPILVSQTANQSETAGKSFAFSLAASSFSDPNGASLSYTATQSDGSALPSWLKFNAVSHSFSGTAPSAASSVAVTVTATDSLGLSAAETFSVAVKLAQGPTLVSQIAPQSWSDGSQHSLSFTSSFIDKAGLKMTYSAHQLSGPNVTSWMSFNPTTAILSGTPTSTQTGTAIIEIDATDSSGASASEQLSISFTHSSAALAPLVGVSSELGQIFHHGA
jgi:hypothetical protein